jgi:hypothetical protein
MFYKLSRPMPTIYRTTNTRNLVVQTKPIHPLLLSLTATNSSIGNLLHWNMLPILYAIDPLGRFGPLLQNFLFSQHPAPQLPFPPSRPNATQIYTKLLQYPSPKGILLLANHNWSLHPTRRFNGHSYLAPTPSITTVQSLGVSWTKLFAHHIRCASRKFITSPLATNILPTPVTR